MPTAPPVSRDPALEVHVFWHRFKNEIFGVIFVVLLAIIGFGAYRLYSERRNSTASTLLAAAKNAQDYEQVIARYPKTPAGATAHLFLAQTQRNERKFTESNVTLQVFIDRYPKHDLVSAAKMAIAANLESMGKMDESLSMYQRIATDYPKSYNAPVALISQVPLFKAKNQTDAARRVCETILTQYRESIWANEAMRELRSFKPSAAAKPPAPPAIAPFPGSSGPAQAPVRPPLAAPTGPPSAPTPNPPKP